MLASRQVLLAAILAGIGAAAWWWVGIQPPETPSSVPRDRRPDYIVEHFSATQMDTAGRVQRHLEGPQLRHYPDDGSSELDRPKLTLFTDQGPPWVASAATGWVSQDGDELWLRGNVVVNREVSATTRPVRIETEALRVEPKRDYAETDLPVSIASEADWLRSTGLRAWFGESLRILFPGRTRALFHIANETSE